MKPRHRVRAEAALRREESRGTLRARVPREVMVSLDAREGDRLLFEEGCDAAVQRAALKGRYFVLRLERANQTQQQALDDGARGNGLEPLDETVRRRCQ